MTDQHSTASPRPWRYEQGTKTIRVERENYWIATVDSFDGAVNNETNAALIVTAVNAYDANQATIKRMREALAACIDWIEKETPDYPVALIKAKTALGR